MLAQYNILMRGQDPLQASYNQANNNQFSNILTNSYGYNMSQQSQPTVDPYQTEYLGKRSNMFEIDQILQKKIKPEFYGNGQFFTQPEPQFQTSQDLYGNTQYGLNAYRPQEALRSTQSYGQQNQPLEGLILQNLNPQNLQRNLMLNSRPNFVSNDQATLQAQLNYGLEVQNAANVRKAINDYNLLQAVQQQQACVLNPNFQTQGTYQVTPQNYVQQGYYQEPQTQTFGLISNPMVMAQPQAGQYMVMNGNQIVQLPGGNFAILNVENNSNYNQIIPQQQMGFNNIQYNNYNNYQAAKQTEVSIPNFDYQSFERSQNYEHSNSTKGSEGEKSDGPSQLSSPKDFGENTFGEQQAVEKKKRRPRHFLSIELTSSPENQALRSKERRLNRWQEKKDEMEKEKVFDRTKYINETDFGHHNDQQKKECPVGEAFQALVPAFGVPGAKKALKMKWNPETLEESQMKTLNENLKEKLQVEINDEKLIKLLSENDHSDESVLNLIDGDKRKYSKYFQVKQVKPKNEAI